MYPRQTQMTLVIPGFPISPVSSKFSIFHFPFSILYLSQIDFPVLRFSGSAEQYDLAAYRAHAD